MTLLYPAALDDAEQRPFETFGDRLDLRIAPYAEPRELRNHRSRNHGRVPGAEASQAPPVSDEVAAALAVSHGLVALDLPGRIGDLAPHLRWVQGVGVGHEHVDMGELESLGVAYSTAAGIAAVPIAEFVMARLLQVWKELRRFDRLQADREWRPAFGSRVAGRTLGIVGLGAIGRAVARRARAFDLTVLATRRSATAGQTDPDVDELLPAAAIDDMLARCDAVVVSAPADTDTENLFDADRFARLPEGAVFCNVARGQLVDEQALLEALEAGRLGAAVLDVVRDEPLRADHPLWDLPNVYLSPHSSASLDGYAERLMTLTAENLRRLLAGEELVNQVLPAAR